MTDHNHATVYIANALREMAGHLLCHRYHRDSKLRMDKVLFDLCNIAAHTLHLRDDPPHTFRDQPTFTHSTPEEPH